MEREGFPFLPSFLLSYTAAPVGERAFFPRWPTHAELIMQLLALLLAMIKYTL